MGKLIDYISSMLIKCLTLFIITIFAFAHVSCSVENTDKKVIEIKKLFGDDAQQQITNLQLYDIQYPMGDRNLLIKGKISLFAFQKLIKEAKVSWKNKETIFFFGLGADEQVSVKWWDCSPSDNKNTFYYEDHEDRKFSTTTGVKFESGFIYIRLTTN